MLVLIVILLSLYAKSYFFKAEFQAQKNNYFSGSSAGQNSISANNNQKNSDPTEVSGKGRYVSPEFGFSFSYPEDYTAGSISEPGKNMVLVQDKNKKGVQILITPFDEPDLVLTPDRIRQDVPDLVMQEQKTVNVGGQSAQAFINPNGVLGKTREVWFVYKGSLYQIVTTPDFDQTLAGMLLTWKFKL